MLASFKHRLMNCETFLNKSLAEKKEHVVKENLFQVSFKGTCFKKVQFRFSVSY